MAKNFWDPIALYAMPSKPYLSRPLPSMLRSFDKAPPLQSQNIAHFQNTDLDSMPPRDTSDEYAEAVQLL
jgi:hypothetical protein